MSYRADWSFKEERAAGASLSKNQMKKKRRTKRLKAGKKGFYTSSGGVTDFYKSKEWRQARYKVLRRYGGACMACGATRSDGVKIHVDHIKPRSKYPHLELDLSNLQVLCEECNVGKGASDCVDWRRPDERDRDAGADDEIALVIAAEARI